MSFHIAWKISCRLKCWELLYQVAFPSAKRRQQGKFESTRSAFRFLGFWSSLSGKVAVIKGDGGPYNLATGLWYPDELFGSLTLLHAENVF